MQAMRCVTRAVGAATIMLALAQTVNAEDLTQWQKSMSITFSGCKPPGGGALTNFPALVVFSNTTAGAGFSYNDFLSPPYGDLRFSAADKATPLDFEVESWNTNGPSPVWVRAPELTSTLTIHAFWGRSSVTAPACMTNGTVWDGRYRAVWHMNDGADSAHISLHGACEVFDRMGRSESCAVSVCGIGASILLVCQ